MIILDTNVLSELLRPDPAKQVERWLAAQDGAKVYFTTSDYEGCGIQMIDPWTFGARQ